MEQFNWQDMLLTTVALYLLLFVLTGCSVIEVKPRQGELPKIELNAAKNICTKDLDAEIRSQKIVLTCEIKL